MRFDRVHRHQFESGLQNNRRLAAARKAVQRDKDSWILFPEYVKHHTAEERVAAIDMGRVQWQIDDRNERAAKWRAVRRRLACFAEPLRTQLLRYWNSRSMVPGHPTYLAGMLYDAEIGRFDPEKAQRELDRCRLLGELTREVNHSLPLPLLPGTPNRELIFIQLHVARQVAQARMPHLFLPLECDEDADVFRILTAA